MLRALERLMEETTAGDPMSLLRWTCKSTDTLAAELRRQGYSISADTVGRRLRELEYSLQANVKTKEGYAPADRDEQFRHINTQVKRFLRTGKPVLSVTPRRRSAWEPSKMRARRGDPRANRRK